MIYKTPYSRLYWSNLEQWVSAAWIIQGRRCSARRNRQRSCHVSALPLELIYECSSILVLAAALDLLVESQPLRGQRATATHTPLIMALKNRIAQIERLNDLASIPDGHNSCRMKEKL